MGGYFFETITLTYDLKRISGFPVGQLNVSYKGPDPLLERPRDLKFEDVEPILKEWGYDLESG